jgi:2-oxoisovalerate dehydrogenase E1 component
MGHHTSGVRKEFYRTAEELELTATNDPLAKLHKKLLVNGFLQEELTAIDEEIKIEVEQQFEKAVASSDPMPSGIADHIFFTAPVTEERGDRTNGEDEKVLMVDAALHAIKEIMEDDPDVILYGQDVGKRLGGVFRETATLGEHFGEHRVFNTAIQEAYIIGSTVGMSAVGVKTIVEIQFGDYIFPGINQLYTEVAKSCFLSNGKFPVQTVIRVPVGAYGGGGPYHSASIESILLRINGIKIVYPSNAADMKGLMKAAFADPNPVIMFEHKGLYWSKVPGTEEAKTIEPAKNYVLPLGIANIVLHADQQKINNGETLCIVTYGMGVYWSKAAAKNYPGQVEIIDLRTLSPLDEDLVFTSTKKHGKCLVVTEEQQTNSFAEALAARISKACFNNLDAPVEVMGALDLPAVPMNISLEKEMLPNAEKVASKISQLLGF